MRISNFRWQEYSMPVKNRNIEFVWEVVQETEIEPRNNPYVETFRYLNREEEHCIQSSVIRGRIPANDPLNLILASIRVAYEYTSRGFTQCVILCESESGTYIYLGTSKLNPEDRVDNKKKAQMVAFHRAVTESEGVKVAGPAVQISMGHIVKTNEEETVGEPVLRSLYSFLSDRNFSAVPVRTFDDPVKNLQYPKINLQLPSPALNPDWTDKYVKSNLRSRERELITADYIKEGWIFE